MNFFVVFLISMVALYKSSEWVIEDSIKLSHILGLSTFAVGFILLAIATSLPELAVSIFASAQNNTALAVGTILGSNFADLTIILGLTTFAGTIYLKKKELLQLVELLFITLLIMIVIFFKGSLEVYHGFVLLILFVVLLSKLYKGGRIEIDNDHVDYKSKEVILRFLIGIAVLVVASKFVVDSSLSMASYFNISSAIVGATIVALGTSLPEFSVGYRAIKNKQYSLALGNLFGSMIANITLVLGSIAVFAPAAIDLTPLFDLLPFLLISTLTIWYLLSRKNRITKEDGFILIMIYFLFIIEKIGLVIFF